MRPLSRTRCVCSHYANGTPSDSRKGTPLRTATRPSLSDSALLRQDLFIGGRWGAASNRDRIDVLDPATGEAIASVAYATRDDVDRAVVAAQEAFPGWAATTAVERASILRAWYELIVEHQDELARILTAEQGKPLAEATGSSSRSSTSVSTGSVCEQRSPPTASPPMRDLSTRRHLLQKSERWCDR